jgi:ribosomal protein S18 acetylase RimI-like enzyme
VRPPESRDAEAIARVLVVTWRATYGHLLPPSYYDDTAFEQRTAMWRSIIDAARPLPRLRVAELDGEVVGFAAAGEPIDDDAPVRELQLYTLYLLPEHHGSGAGQALLEAVLGGDRAQLWVAADNPRAHRFYRRNGFVPDGAVKNYPGTSLVEVRLVR